MEELKVQSPEDGGRGTPGDRSLRGVASMEPTDDDGRLLNSSPAATASAPRLGSKMPTRHKEVKKVNPKPVTKPIPMSGKPLPLSTWTS